MAKKARRAVSAVSVALVLVAGGAAPAMAGDWEDVEIVAETPGVPEGGNVPVKQVRCPADPGTGVETCTWGDRKWNGRCFARVADPQPVSTDPVWNGHRDAAGNPDGVILDCLARSCFEAGPGATCLVERFWATATPGEVTPRVLAQRAVASMQLRAPQIGMTGGDPPDGMQIVGIPAWMWAADPGESTTGPITRTAVDGGTSVTATAVLDKTVWSMGNGTKVTCAGKKAAGTPYEGRYDKSPSPTCGYTYTMTSVDQPNEAFTVTVRAYWTVTWSGGGASGSFPVEVHRSTPKQVGELQALIVRPDRG